MEILRICGNTSKELIERFSPNSQLYYCKDLETVHDEKYPSLSEVNRAYGEDCAALWLIPHLVDLARFTSVKDRFSDSKIVSLADIIQSQYYFLTITELMSFFVRFKAGKYSDFYGSVDPLVITSSLMKYCMEREVELNHIGYMKEQQLLKEQRQFQEKVKVTYEEYIRQKEQLEKRVNDEQQRQSD